ncbi:winged helix-turn-helix transcriptional regulator [soil metagenome]
MRSYGQYCPLAKSAEILGDRWTLLILRELIMGSDRFNDIERGLPRISRTLLSGRLQALERAGLVEKRTDVAPRATSYHLSPAGEDLVPVVVGLGEWGARWAFGEPERDELDPILLLWWMRGRVNHDALPLRRTVVRFDFRGAQRARYWLVLEPGDASVCLQDPGFDADLIVNADLAAIHEVWFGRRSLAEAVAARTVCFDGPRALQRGFGRWFALSPLAGAVRAATRDRPAKDAGSQRAARTRQDGRRVRGAAAPGTVAR